MPRFVVLRHEVPPTAARPSHWDFMFEGPDAALKTWALESVPDGREEQIARQLADHRPLYLGYEGPLSEGRGEVFQWDRGDCSVISTDANAWQLHLQGEQLIGEVLLTRVGESGAEWRYRFAPDEGTGPG